MQERIISLTGEMIFSGVFNHLSDTELNALHKLLFTAKKPGYNNAEAIMSYWYKGNFDDNAMNARLLHACNESLASTGHSMLEVCA